MIQIGSFDIKNKICPNAGLNYDTKFRILVFNFDNKLMKLRENYYTINKIVESIINRWRLYKLGVHGRVIIAKTIYLLGHDYGRTSSGRL